jgi:hypothetical protein
VAAANSRWLLGDDSAFVTGANLVIDGGMTRPDDLRAERGPISG